MADLSTHYKETDPMNTVQNVTDFFTSNGFQLKISDVTESEAGTHYCHVDVYKNNVKLGGANGKGVTKEYSLASGHAELYERFCNGMLFGKSYYFNNKLMNENYKKHQYYFRPDEKILTKEELINNVPTLKKYLEEATFDDPELLQLMLDINTNEKYIGVPCLKIDHSNIIYTDPRLIITMARSVGMAAGNTVTEGLVQGLSEIVEAKGNIDFFESLISNDIHYALRLENIKNPTLQTIIQNIKSLGYDFYLFDLSYNSQVPTMMSLLINKEDGRLNINFGSFPVFDIAAERVLTELYQGIKSYTLPWIKTSFQMPYKQYTLLEIHEVYGNSISGEVFPASFFDSIEYKDSYNTEVFIDQYKTNDELLKYYCELFDKLKYDVYYIDNSLSDKIHAIQIFIADQPENTFYQQNFGPKDQNAILQTKNYLNKLKEFYYLMCNNELHDIEGFKFIDILQTCTTMPATVMNIITNLILWYDCILVANNMVFGFCNFFPIITGEMLITDELITSLFYKPYKKFLQLLAYINTGAYSENELLDIFNNIFNYQITLNDIYKCQNISYRAKNMYIKPLHSYIHGKEFQEVILAYVNNVQYKMR